MQRNGILAAAMGALAIVAGGIYPCVAAAQGISSEKLRALVDELIKELPPGVSASYASIEDGAIKGVAVHWTSADSALDYTVDEIDLVNPNLDFAKAWSDALADAGHLTKDTAIPFYDGATLRGVTMHLVAKQAGDAVDMTGSIGSMTSQGLRLYPWALSQPGVPSFAELGALLANPPSSPSLDDAMPSIRFAAAGCLAAAYDGGSAEDMKYTIKIPTMPGSDAPQEIIYEIKKVAAAGVDRCVFAGFSGDGISFDMGSGGAAKIGHVGYGLMDLRQAASKVLVAPTPTPDMLDGTRIDKIEYADAEVQPPSQPPVKIGNISISGIAFSGAVPVSGAFSLQGVQISKDALSDPEAEEALDQLGLDRVTISLGAAYAWDLAQKRIQLHDVVVKVDELGALNLSVDVAEITPDMAGAMGAQLAHAKLIYSDASFADRAIKAAAAMQQQDPAAFRQQLTAMIPLMSAQFTSDSPPLAAAAQAVIDFLGAPGSLTIELSPPKALPIMQLSALAGGGVPPGQIATMLGLAVTANK
jgi:hypothetical protein